MKKILIVVTIITLIAVIFALPKWLLFGQQNSEKTAVRSDLTAHLALSEEMDLIDKLLILADDEVQTVHLELAVEEVSEVRSILREELENLRKLGYRGGGIDLDELEADSGIIESIVFIDAQRILRVYRVETVGAVTLIDMQTHKILSIVSHLAAWERAADALNMIQDDVLLSMQSLEAMAKYYDLMIEEPTVIKESFDSRTQWSLVSAYFVNAEGERIVYGLNFNMDYDYIFWGTVGEERMTAEEEIVE